MTDRESIIEVADASRHFGGGRSLFGRTRPALQAVRSVSLDIMPGETLGIVGESGCGKSTLARMLVGLDAPTGGDIRYRGTSVAALARHDFAGLARKVQYVFQDPAASLNPRKTVGAVLDIPLKRLTRLDRTARQSRIGELMDAVGLDRDLVDRYPHELSGGQAQRVAIARALAAEPELIILDEPVSALDVSVQAQILDLLAELKARFGLTYVFISHDLAVVEAICDRVAVMYLGRIAEIGPVASVFRRPCHHYTSLLLRSAPVPGRPLAASHGDIGELPDPYAPPPGCAFAPRCPAATKGCVAEQPALAAMETPGHRAACIHPEAVEPPPGE